MLKYTKMILLKVSFDEILFEKELRKSFVLLKEAELLQLRLWCYGTFPEEYHAVLIRVFPTRDKRSDGQRTLSSTRWNTLISQHKHKATNQDYEQKVSELEV